MTQQEPGRRMVSKEEYIRQIGNKASLSCYGVMLLILAFVCVLTIALIFSVLSGLFKTHSVYPVLVSFILSFGPLYLGYLGVRLLQEASQYPMGVPLTRANTGDLPAPESLVRASEEPLQAQQSVLLRAATETTEEHKEQLLRASTGGQEQP